MISFFWDILTRIPSPDRERSLTKSFSGKNTDDLNLRTHWVWQEANRGVDSHHLPSQLHQSLQRCASVHSWFRLDTANPQVGCSNHPERASDVRRLWHWCYNLFFVSVHIKGVHRFRFAPAKWLRLNHNCRPLLDTRIIPPHFRKKISLNPRMIALHRSTCNVVRCAMGAFKWKSISFSQPRGRDNFHNRIFLLTIFSCKGSHIKKVMLSL